MVSRRLCLALGAVAVLLPLLIVQVVPTDTEEPYVFRTHQAEYLGASTNGYLQYHRVEILEGTAPASEIVVALDQNYTRGLDVTGLSAGTEAWMQAGLMTPDVFYGDQYLFFGLPQVYVRQVKMGVLWPDQWSELRVLYLSPVETLAAPLQIPFLVLSDSFTLRILAVLVARCVLIAATIAVIAKRRFKDYALGTVLLAYAVASIVLTVPLLGHLY